MTKELTKEQISVLDDVCLYYVTEEDRIERQITAREERLEALHQEVLRLKDVFDRTGNAEDEAAWNAAFDRWVSL